MGAIRRADLGVSYVRSGPAPAGSLNDCIARLLTRICQYQTARQTRKNSFKRGKLNDPINLFFEELKNWLAFQLPSYTSVRHRTALCTSRVCPCHVCACIRMHADA